MIVSVHPLLNHAALRARDDAHMQHVPIVTVITDLGKVHESWLSPDADAVVVPAREVYQRALSRGVPPARLHLLGHPIHPKFDDVTGSKADLRAALGLPPADVPVVMLMAGGEGGGKLLSTALALARARVADSTSSSSADATSPRAEARRAGAHAAHARCTCSASPIRFPSISAPSTCSSPRPARERSPRRTRRSFPSSSTITFPGQERGNVDFVRHNGLGLIALQRLGRRRRVQSRSLIASPDRLDDDPPQSRDRRAASAVRAASPP